jgi:hypothetical protein
MNVVESQCSGPKVVIEPMLRTAFGCLTESQAAKCFALARHMRQR